MLLCKAADGVLGLSLFVLGGINGANHCSVSLSCTSGTIKQQAFFKKNKKNPLTSKQVETHQGEFCAFADYCNEFFVAEVKSWIFFEFSFSCEE